MSRKFFINNERIDIFKEGYKFTGATLNEAATLMFRGELLLGYSQDDMVVGDLALVFDEKTWNAGILEKIA